MRPTSSRPFTTSLDELDLDLGTVLNRGSGNNGTNGRCYAATPANEAAEVVRSNRHGETNTPAEVKPVDGFLY